MFYSHEILTNRKYGVATVWLVATLGPKSHAHKVTRKAILNVDVRKACDTIIHPEAPMALRLQSSLLYGVSRVYSQQCVYVLQDAQATQNNIRALFKVVRSNAIDMDVAASRSDPQTMPDDPAFMPDLVLPPMDFDLFGQTLEESQQSLLSSQRTRSRSPSASANSLPTPGQVESGSMLHGGFGDSSVGKTPSAIRNFGEDDAGLLEDPFDFEIDEGGNIIDLSQAEQQRRRATGNASRGDRASAASDRVRREHEQAGVEQATLGRLDDEGDYVMQFNDEDNILPDAEAFATAQQGGQPQDGRDKTESFIEESSTSAEAPMRRRRARPVPTMAAFLDVNPQIRSAVMNDWQSDYATRMEQERAAKLARSTTHHAKATANFMLWGNGLGGIGSIIKASGSAAHPLADFMGDALRDLILGDSANGRTKRGRDADAEDEGYVSGRNVRGRVSDYGEGDMPIARGNEDDDGMVINFDDDMPPLGDHTATPERGREALPPLTEHVSSAMPWNVSSSIVSYRQASLAGTLPRGPGSVVSARKASRLTSASPLVGRGRVLSEEYHDVGEGQVDFSSMNFEGMDEFDIHGPGAAVNTQTAGNSQWLAEALATESHNFKAFVQASAHELAEAGATPIVEVDIDIQDREWIGFETLLPPSETSRVTAAQAFLHVLSLATKNQVGVAQQDWEELYLFVKIEAI